MCVCQPVCQPSHLEMVMDVICSIGSNGVFCTESVVGSVLGAEVAVSDFPVMTFPGEVVT